MEYVLLGWPPDGPTLQLDHERFSYAGKFVMSSTGKAVARESDGGIVGAVAFNEDRTDETALWLRYVTVRDDRRGEGIGSNLCAGLRRYAIDEGYDRVRIAVNNPYAFQALYRAGFEATGETTGIAERILEAPTPEAVPYREGISAYLDRDDLSDAERAFVAKRRNAGPPEPVDPPTFVIEDATRSDRT